ncbi:hypothetical protein MMC08_008329 [Hypocenomyce scalaris]|nr:hypothetical protein [Hypocenomyce scalaris]
MSSDLWKEFGGASQDPSENPWSQTVSRNNDPSAQEEFLFAFPTSTRMNEGMVKSGEVNLGPNSNTTIAATSDAVRPFEGGEDVWGDLSLLGKTESSIPSRGGNRPDRHTPVEVLFDATDEPSIKDDDDFGDFEDPNSQLSEAATYLSLPSPVPFTLSKDLLPDFENVSPGLASSPYPQAPVSPSFQERNPFSDLAISTDPAKEIVEKEASPITAWPAYVHPKPAPYMDAPIDFLGEESDWGDFIDATALDSAPASDVRHHGTLGASNRNCQTSIKPLPSIPDSRTHEPDISAPGQTSSVILKDSRPNSPNGRVPNIATTSMPQPARAVQPTPLTTMQAPMQSGTVPPSNIPPPSVLLTLFPPLFQTLPTEIKALFSNPEDHSEAQSYVDHARANGMKVCLSVPTVAARIIGGRGLRWKRDTHLSQSMRVGPAHAGKVGGMKLTGLDKTEVLRENREVLEIVRVWKQQVGRIRSAVTSANSQLVGSTFKVPSLSENPLVRTAKAGDGAIGAPNSCVLCGLKREERLDKIDVSVEDSFGEWWTDHWGHTECRIFWEKQKDSLRKR